MKDKPKKISRYRIIIDRNLCIGAATCVALEPKVFQLDKENKAVLIDPQDPAKTHNEFVYEVNGGFEKESILMAAKSCPTNAIIVMDEETGKQIYP
jgi:ferredoxin